MKLTRRAILKGAGSGAIFLPLSQFFMQGEKIYSAEGDELVTPKLVTYSIPNGCEEKYWSYDYSLAPLKDHRKMVTAFKGLRNLAAEKGGRDGHEQGGATLFVGSELKNGFVGGGPSIDQFASRVLNKNSILENPLALGVYRGLAGGFYRNTAWSRRSWNQQGIGTKPLQSPLDVYRVLFGIQKAQVDETLHRSVLSSVLDQYQSLLSDRSNLGSGGKLLLQDHADKVRGIEKMIDKYKQDGIKACKNRSNKPEEIDLGPSGLLPYELFAPTWEILLDMAVMALECGVTNTLSLMFGSSGEEYLNTSVGDIACHESSHYKHEEELENFIDYKKYYISVFSRFLDRLASVGMANGGRLIDYTVVLMGTEFGEPRTHTISPQPHLIAGGSRLGVRLGQVIDVDLKSNTNDLYKTVLLALGLDVAHFGKEQYNTGVIAGIVG